MVEKFVVKIRFNTDFKEGDVASKEWRVIVNGSQNFCNHVTIKCACNTSKDFIEGVGNKWHISCAPQKIEYVKDESSKEKSNFYKEIILS